MDLKSCKKKYNVCLEDGTFPSAMLVKELKPGALDGRKWVYHDSEVMQLDEKEAQLFDDGLEKKWRRSISQARKNFIFTAVLFIK